MAVFLCSVLHMSQKSSTFAAAMNEGVRYYKELWSDEKVTPMMLMSLAQRIYENRKNEHANALELLVESTTQPVECTMENHFIMCFFLHNAEQYRQILLQEVREDCQASDFEHFPMVLRNGCFDIYLQSRVRDWQEKSAKHPKAIRPFTELECFRYLFTFEDECHKKLLSEAPNDFIRQLMEYYMLYFSVVIKDKYPNEENLVLLRKIQRQTESAQSSPAPEQAKEYCEYINREKLAEQHMYTLDKFEAMFAKATKGEAPELAAFLKKYEKLGVLEFKGHSKRRIYDTLRAHFKEMRDYTYQNFTMAY